MAGGRVCGGSTVPPALLTRSCFLPSSSRPAMPVHLRCLLHAPGSQRRGAQAAQGVPEWWSACLTLQLLGSGMRAVHDTHDRALAPLACPLLLGQRPGRGAGANAVAMRSLLTADPLLEKEHCCVSCCSPKVGDLNAELDKLVEIANSWRDDAGERRVTQEQAAVMRGLMQVGVADCWKVRCAVHRGGSRNSLSVGPAAACAAGSCLLVDSLRFRCRSGLHPGGGMQLHCLKVEAAFACLNVLAENHGDADEVDRAGAAVGC